MPITYDELRALYLNLESDRVERKQNASDHDRLRQAICAFANDLPNHKKPGIVFVGQSDDGNCANFIVDDEILLALSHFRSDGKLLPFPNMNVSRREIDECTLAVIEVEPTDNPPVRFDGRIWIRVGPRRALATAEEERRLLEKRRWGNLSFDAQGVVGATVDDINLQVFRAEYLPSAVDAETLKENHRPEREQLQALRLVRPDLLPTNCAILMLGKNPTAWIPGAYVQFLRIDGAKLTDQVRNQRTIDGTLPDQLRVLDEILKGNVEQKADISGPLRREVWDYPIVALRQLLRNAVLHRAYEGTNAPVRLTWYNDRIEIQSPGGPYGQVTKENFGSPGITDYRNPTLAEALKVLGYVERFGIGIATARQRLEENGNPPPEFVVEDQHVLAIVRRE